MLYRIQYGDVTSKKIIKEGGEVFLLVKNLSDFWAMVNKIIIHELQNTDDITIYTLFNPIRPDQEQYIPVVSFYKMENVHSKTVHLHVDVATYSHVIIHNLQNYSDHLTIKIYAHPNFIIKNLSPDIEYTIVKGGDLYGR